MRIRSGAKLGHRPHVWPAHEARIVRPSLADARHLAQALLLKCRRRRSRSTSSTSKDLGDKVGGDGEGEADVHPARIPLDGCVDERLDLGERDDLVEVPPDLRLLHAEDSAVEIDVLASGQLRVEAGSHLEQRADPTVDDGGALGRLGDAREDLEQRRLPRAVPADDPDDVTFGDVERDISQSPDASARRLAGVLGRSG